MTTTYPLGALVPIRFEVFDAAGDHVDSATQALTINLPDGTQDISQVLVRTAEGTYDLDYAPPQAGVFSWFATSTAPTTSTDLERFRVRDLATDYATLTDLKAMLAITRDGDDDNLYVALDAAQAWIDRNVRVFNRASTATSRRFTVANGSLLLVDDIASTQDLVVSTSNGNGTFAALPASSWTTWPTTALTGAAPSPVTGIQLVGGRWCPDVYGVQVTARWGWPQVPAEVTQATLLLAARLFKRKDSPSGLVEGVGEIGLVRITASDADVRSLLGPFMLPGFA